MEDIINNFVIWLDSLSPIMWTLFSIWLVLALGVVSLVVSILLGLNSRRKERRKRRQW